MPSISGCMKFIRPKMTRFRRSNIFERFIYRYYGQRCVRCNHTSGLVIHEIHPRSHFGGDVTPFTLENCVLLCGECHEWAHGMGTKQSIPVLTMLQQEWETKHGRQDSGSQINPQPEV